MWRWQPVTFPLRSTHRFPLPPSLCSLQKRRNSGLSFPVSPDSPVDPAVLAPLGGVTTYRLAAANGNLSRASSGVEAVKSPQKNPYGQ